MPLEIHSKSKDLLKKNNLRSTQIRLQVLSIFLSKNEIALTHQEIENTFEKVDRVTLYRTLNSFEENGIIHKILDREGVQRFALCKHTECGPNEHHDNHAHFQCTICSKTFCLDDLEISGLKIPADVTVSHINVMVLGSCEKCKS